MKKYFSMTLFLAIAMSMLSFCILAGNAAAADNKVADLPTLHDYNTFFDDKSTDFAGLVWTDKSVFTDIPEDKKIDDVDISSLKVGDDSFLVALSAAASTKSITGYELTPTDTVFVLDISSSMYSNLKDKDGKTINRRIVDLVPAANDAIGKLLNANYNNRIAVVLFSGIASDEKGFIESEDNDEKVSTENKSGSDGIGSSPANSARVLLPLGRYIPGKNGEYLHLNDKGENQDIKTRFYVETADNLKKWDTTTRTLVSVDKTSMRVTGATYIQNGLFKAWDQVFKNVDPKAKAGDSEHGNDMQIGVTRIPVLVLMGDGGPTSVTTNYAPQSGDIGPSNAGNGALRYNTNDMAFLTQLTAGWVKNQIGNHYNRGLNDKQKVTPLFYTVGVGLNKTNPNPDKGGRYDRLTSFQARHIMEPDCTWEKYVQDYKDEELYQEGTYTSNSGDGTVSSISYGGDEKGFENVTNRINALWQAFKKNETNSLTLPSLSWRQKELNITYTADADNHYYVNKFFNVKDGENMTDAFQSIVKEIELQSRYTATEVEDEDGLYSGYVTFVDKIGEHMEVRDVKGLMVKNGDYRLFTGESFAELCTKENLGEWFEDNSATSEGYLLVTAIATRLGLDTAIGSDGRELVCDLIDKAYKAGQLGPGKGHSFGWYADENGHILESGGIDTAFWNFNVPNDKAPTGAVYRVRSYLYYDELGNNSEDVQRNTLFVSVQVRERIADGEISVVWRVPSNMLPMNEYKITLSKSGDTTTATGRMTEELPIRLLYEVGMKEGYRSHEIEETIANLSSMEQVSLKNVTTDHEKIVKDEAGSYCFYTNSFDTTVNPQNLDEHPTQKRNTLSYYEPSRKNERFRFTKETDILVKAGEGNTEPTVMIDEQGNKYVLYKGEKPSLDSVAEEKYYFMRRVFEKQGNGDAYAIKIVPGLIRKPSLVQSGADALQQREDGSWYIPVGTIEYPQSGIMEQKASNKTNTFEYSDAATVEIVDKNYPAEGITAGEYIISSILGNNGRLKVTPDTGIALLKKVPEGTMTDQTFRFTLIRTDEEETGSRECKVIRKTADGTETTSTEEFNNGVLEIENVQAGELIRVLGLTPGEVYTINEDMGFGYNLDEITVQQNPMADPVKVPLAENIEIIAGSQVYVTFTNKVGDFGMLALKKIVSHDYKYGFDIPMDKEFLFQLTFEKVENGANLYANDVIYDMDGNAYVLDARGVTKDNVKLKPNQEIVFTGLADGTKVTVKEIIGPHEGYVVEEIVSVADSVDVIDENTVQVSITGGEEASVTVHNMYKEPYVPQTGDNSRLILWTALLGLCAAGTLLLKKRREH